MAAQLIHAAGESSPGNLPTNTYAIALAARDEAHLLEIEAKLKERGIPHHPIREPDPPWAGAIMSIGIPPVHWREARRALSTLPLLGGRHDR
jgi:hypothetical protein